MSSVSIRWAPKEPMAGAKDLKFSTNWNGKLYTRFFTTIRKTAWYKVGDYVNVYLKGELCFQGIVRERRDMLLNHIGAYTATLDTGYSVEETREILRKMYPGTDWNTQTLAVLLIENIDYIHGPLNS